MTTATASPETPGGPTTADPTAWPYTHPPLDRDNGLVTSTHEGFPNMTSWAESPNMTASIPEELRFNSSNLVSVVAYSVLFVVAAAGNLTVFITLFRNRRRHRKSRVNLFIMHLCAADLLVTFVMLPMETAWHVTVSWRAGDAACRIGMFFRTFGFYLGSFILVCISLDRYFAILRPLSLNDADRRGKIMLVFAWLFSIIASIPQSIIFHVESHPLYPWFTQCVTFNFFPSPSHELAYNLFNILSIYVLPLLVIVASYSAILWEVSKKTLESRRGSAGLSPNKLGSAGSAAAGATAAPVLRRSGMGRIQRARIRTLRMTVIIVLVFLLCWTPYYVISIWFWVDRASASRIDPKVQRGLFIFAVSNSCMDPIVYGMFTIDFKGEFRRCCCMPFSRLRRRAAAAAACRDSSASSSYSYSAFRRHIVTGNGAALWHNGAPHSPSSPLAPAPSRENNSSSPSITATRTAHYDHLWREYRRSRPRRHVIPLSDTVSSGGSGSLSVSCDYSMVTATSVSMYYPVPGAMTRPPRGRISRHQQTGARCLKHFRARHYHGNHHGNSSKESSSEVTSL